MRKSSGSFWGLKDVLVAIATDPILFLPLLVAMGLCTVLGVIVWFAIR
ncbi:hypothetical protein [Caulobacter sp. S45]|nr:hypothetical protein [Caulobacter sp. S45]